MHYIYSLIPSMMDGLITTIEVFSLTLIIAIPLGLVTALCRLSGIRAIKEAAKYYICIMRGTPLLLQLVFIFFGLPIVGITFDRFTAAIIAFTLNYAAYFGEIFRAGIESIDRGQYEAAAVLGFNPKQTFMYIIFPQMTKRILPPAANEVITLVKDTSLVYVVGIGELLRAGKIASNRDASLIPLIVVGAFYLILTAVLTRGFDGLEKGYSYYE